MDSDLMQKVIELSQENGALKKEIEMLRIENNELKKKLNNSSDKPTFTEADLNDIASAIDDLFDKDKRTTTKAKMSASQRLEESLAKYRDEAKKENIIKRAMKKNIFVKKNSNGVNLWTMIC